MLTARKMINIYCMLINMYRSMIMWANNTILDHKQLKTFSAVAKLNYV